jgi:hypothetical protein
MVHHPRGEEVEHLETIVGASRPHNLIGAMCLQSCSVKPDNFSDTVDLRPTPALK